MDITNYSEVESRAFGNQNGLGWVLPGTTDFIVRALVGAEVQGSPCIAGQCLSE